jgi:membrane protein
VSAPSANRGRTADEPDQIPAKGWWDIAWRVAKRLGSDNVSLVAGGLAMYAMLSVFPALAALVFIYGLFATPSEVLEQMRAFSGVLPPGTWSIFETELQSIVQHGQRTLTLAAVGGGLVSLWSARSGMSALMTATNIAYGEREKRSFIAQLAQSLAFTILAVGGFLSLLALAVAVPLALKALGTSAWVQIAADVLRFALLWVMTLLALAFIYRYGPARERARWRWVTWGSAIAATLWLAASALFSVYVSSFGSYGRTYGALGVVIVLLMWFYLSSFIVVLGAEINAEMERQTVKDTTVRGAPLGRRGAYAADTVGPSAGEEQPQDDKRGIAEPGQLRDIARRPGS